MELLAEGRTAEVFFWDEGQVVKLDRPEWVGLSHYEAGVLEQIAASGVRVPRVFGTVSVDGRTGVVLEYLEGPSLADAVRDDPDVGPQEAVEFVALHLAIHRPVEGFPDQIEMLRANIDRTGLASATKAELSTTLDDLDDGQRVLCHGDFTVENVIVTAHGPVVIDWLTATSGVPAADFARSLVLMGWPDGHGPALGRFLDAVREEGCARRGLDDLELAGWIRIVAAARLDEGFTGAAADRLVALATGQTPAARHNR